MRVALNLVGTLLVLFGRIWFLEGINVLPDSFMIAGALEQSLTKEARLKPARLLGIGRGKLRYKMCKHRLKSKAGPGFCHAIKKEF